MDGQEILQTRWSEPTLMNDLTLYLLKHTTDSLLVIQSYS